MRLVHKGTEVVPLFTLAWEVACLAHLAEQGVEWVPLARIGDTRTVGEIHTQAHAIRLQEGFPLVDRQVAVLGPVKPTKQQ